MIQELDTVVLNHNLAEYGLEKGDVGAVVYCYKDQEAWEVEFVTASCSTIAVLTLTSQNIRAMKNKDILHVREFVKMGDEKRLC